MKEDVTAGVHCAKCNAKITDAYELKNLKLCEDCCMDELACKQPKQCKMRN